MYLTLYARTPASTFAVYANSMSDALNDILSGESQESIAPELYMLRFPDCIRECSAAHQYMYHAKPYT